MTQTNSDFIAEDLRQMLQAPNYTQWIFSFMQPYLGRRILEIGAGIGALTQKFVQHADFVCGLEPNPACCAYLAKTFTDTAKFKLISSTIENCDWKDIKKYKFDTLICCNVLEHIENDKEALLRFRRLLANEGGRLILFVPAFPAAYGNIDKAVGHFRRYSKRTLLLLMEEAHMRLITARYVNLIGLLGWIVNSHISRRAAQSDAQIRLFNRLVPFLAFLERIIAPPLGMSLIGIAEIAHD